MLDPWLWSLSEQIRDRQIVEAAIVHGSPTTDCPDCESHWDRATEDACSTCGLSLDDLRARLERKVS